jgi:hypothetical protein
MGWVVEEGFFARKFCAVCNERDLAAARQRVGDSYWAMPPRQFLSQAKDFLSQANDAFDEACSTAAQLAAERR